MKKILSKILFILTILIVLVNLAFLAFGIYEYVNLSSGNIILGPQIMPLTIGILALDSIHFLILLIYFLLKKKLS